MGGALSGLLRLLRYRFLLFAGLLPYALGSSAAFHAERRFDAGLFLVGLGGILLVLVGVEAFNEYFDWRAGTDRVFQLEPVPVTVRTFQVGVIAFSGALLVATLLALRCGMPIIAFSLAGFVGAFLYLGPPLRLAYRGYGEITIACCYGPLMTLGSYYVQTRRIDVLPLLVSLIPGLLLFGIAVLNEIPDYFQDRLVGKRNICVRVGQASTVRLYACVVTVAHVILLAALLSGTLPPLAWAAFVCLPLTWRSTAVAMRASGTPRQLLPAIRLAILQYTGVLLVLIAGCAL
ncbi:MAG: prenyltransferase [Acidobacteriota bacterium]